RLDVWVKNRTGPQLRFLHNETSASGDFVAFRLTGTTSNRDAVGAVVELTAGGRRRVQQVAAGSGYLAQSSSTVHFGLGADPAIESLEVRWPGGETESIAPPAGGGYYRVVQGSGKAQPIEGLPGVAFGAIPPESRNELPPTRLLLKTPLPLPGALLRKLGLQSDRDRAALVNLWAHWCEPCAEEIRAYAGQTDRLEASSIDWRPVSLDAPVDREAATTWMRAQFEAAGVAGSPTPVFLDDGALRMLEAVVEHVTGRTTELPIPANLVIDAAGNLQMLYLGPVFPDRFLSDAAAALDPSADPSRRSLYPGRWYYRSPRNYTVLGRRLAESGQLEAARFYARLASEE
ncbi:MAG: redoxin domain-containing protein, partial [Acidobacteria bacterium]|nr:redoxin domain-containing protein [Acidobacteriota bacterium]NIQ83693.1 redoxin domain-containing protein [Acidobacteriota bacterium]